MKDLLWIVFLSCLSNQLLGQDVAQKIKTDGVFIETTSGGYVELMKNEGQHCYYVKNVFNSFWKYPKKWFTLESNIVEVDVAKVVFLKSSLFTDESMAKLEMFEVQELKLNLPFFHCSSKVYDDGQIAYRSKEDEKGMPVYLDFKYSRISENKYMVEINSDLEKGKLYGVFVNNNYYIFKYR